MNIIFFASPAEFRKWLTANYAKCGELWVGFHKKESGKPTMAYSEALDEALCFGWIDGVRKSVAADAYTIRFTPRKPKSQWSAVNIRKVEKLKDAARMRQAGLKAFEGASGQSRTYSYEQRNEAKFSAGGERQFRANKKAWEFFQGQPPWYRRTSTFWVISAKKEETQQKRLAELIECSAEGKSIKALTRKAVPKR